MRPAQCVTRRMKSFRYLSPATLGEVVSVLSEYGGKARLLAGGTDLLPSMKRWLETPEYVVDLKGVKGLDYIREEGDDLRIGALATMSAIGASAAVKGGCPPLHEAAQTFATATIRNMATIGGNICRSSPAADTVPPLMAFDAKLRLVGLKGERTVPIESFFTGAGTNTLADEVLTGIVIPLKARPGGSAFQKMTRNSSDLAKISCAVRIEASNGRCDDIRIVLGAVADRAARARKAEQAIRHAELSDEIIERSAGLVVEDISPITDARSTAEYRMRVSRVLVRRLITKALERATQG